MENEIRASSLEQVSKGVESERGRLSQSEEGKRTSGRATASEEQQRASERARVRRNGEGGRVSEIGRE